MNIIGGGGQWVNETLFIRRTRRGNWGMGGLLRIFTDYFCCHSAFFSPQRFPFHLSESASACASPSVSLSESLALV